MKLVLTAPDIATLEKRLNEYHYSTTYKIIDDKVMFCNPLKENTNYFYKTRGKKHQIFILN
jgi:hypothetical protein